MRVRITSNANELASEHMSVLIANEVLNARLLGAVERSVRRIDDAPDDASEEWFASIVDDEGQFHGAAWHAPPGPVGLSETSDRAGAALASALVADARAIESVLGLSESVHRFSRSLAAVSGPLLRETMRLGLHTLNHVTAREPAPGVMREAHGADAELALAWANAFALETGHKAANAPPMAAFRLYEEGRLHVWEVDGEVRSMAARTTESPNGGSISYVYTPPAWRGRGYAEALVADVSRRLLAGGKSFCYLFTDLANPTSNRIYKRIGYGKIAEFVRADAQASARG